MSEVRHSSYSRFFQRDWVSLELFEKPPADSVTRSVNWGRLLPSRASFGSSTNNAVSTMLWFSSPVAPAARTRKVSLHKLRRSAWSRTTAMLDPPWGMPSLVNHARRLPPSSISRDRVRMASD